MVNCAAGSMCELSDGMAVAVPSPFDLMVQSLALKF